MSSISGILSTASSALRASQAAISVTGQNVANATTEGYSRQAPLLQTAPGTRLPEGQFGGGVLVRGVDRSRDVYLDGSFRSESSRSEGFRSHAELLQRVESLMAEPGPEGVSSALDRFFSAWSEMASAPESPIAREGLRQEATALVERMNELATGLDRLRQEAMERVTQQVARVQALVSDLVATNLSIIASEADGMPAPDLRDARDRTLDELATLVPIEVQHNGDGSVRVNLGGIGLVDGPRVIEVGLAVQGGQFRLQVGGNLVPLSAAGGRLGGSLEVVNVDLPGLRSGLDTFANSLVTAVNELHRTGTNPLGQEGVDFFHAPVDGNGDAVQVTASTIRLSDPVRGSALAIAAGIGSQPGAPENEYRSGSNDVALLLSGLRDREVPGLGRSLTEHYGEVVGGVAHRVRKSVESGTLHQALAQQADIRRTAVSGVSMDEEMVRLAQFQASYSAAARVLAAADEMLQALLRI